MKQAASETTRHRAKAPREALPIFAAPTPTPTTTSLLVTTDPNQTNAHQPGSKRFETLLTPPKNASNHIDSLQAKTH